MTGITIAGTGSALPANRLTNEQLSSMVDTNDEWIVSRTGISERGVLADGESLLDLAEAASLRALEDAGIPVDEVAAIVVATLTPERACPSLACDLQARLGVSGFAFDISAACSGFIYGLKVAQGLIAVDGRPVLVVGAEHLSRVVDWTDRSTCVLFGDGAGAAVVVAGDAPAHIECRSIPDVEGALLVGGESPFIRMDGKAVYRFAVKELGDVLESVCASAGIAVDALEHVVAHQANERIILAAADRLGLDLDRFFMNIATVGNTSAASVPIALDQLNRTGRLERGATIGLVAFGGGFTSGAAVLEW